ncbi:hypothetical protein A3L01_00555 [Thermococcus barossii]|uniref:Uncharacterized protein n=1 Tax=Thermococcus barossii TaxID=54077 RepID=A0A2Z2MGY7_9EURY|nr:hypothetical protein A3L01_00555 [Thermococcus barossii]
MGGSGVTFNDWFAVYPPINRTTGEPQGWIAHLIYWPEKFNLMVPCALGGLAMHVSSDTGKSGSGYYRPSVGPEDRPIHERMCGIRRENAVLPAGDAYLAVQYVPAANSTWRLSVLTPIKEWTDFKDYNLFHKTEVELNATCTCPIKAVMEAFDASVMAKGFEEVKPWITPTENNCFEPLSAKLYRKDDQYLYVEFARVKGMDLVRVLMIMGNEETVKAYTEAFTAGVVENNS